MISPRKKNENDIALSQTSPRLNEKQKISTSTPKIEPLTKEKRKNSFKKNNNNKLSSNNDVPFTKMKVETENLQNIKIENDSKILSNIEIKESNIVDHVNLSRPKRKKRNKNVTNTDVPINIKE